MMAITPVINFSSQAADASNSGAVGTNSVSALTDSDSKCVLTMQKPSWLTDLSVGVRESYDDNVYAYDVRTGPFDTGIPGSEAGLRRRDSWITTVSPKVGFNFAPLLGKETAFQTLGINYSPDFVTYHDEDSESYNLHRVVGAVKGKSGDFSFNAENTFSYIDGNKYGLTYPTDLNAYSTAIVRERREQIQDRYKVDFQYDIDDFFVRPTSSLSYYDLRTEQINKTGYQNFADRYDINGGLDLGYKVLPEATLLLGYRHGVQYQEKYSWNPYASSSDYERVLAGFETKPLKWLKVNFLAGPDFRSYAQNAAVIDHHPLRYYGEGNVAATLTDNDSIAFKYKQYQWVSSTGKVPYYDSGYELTYTRKLNSKVSWNLGARFCDSDYTSGAMNGAYIKRDDAFYMLSTGITYDITKNLVADLSYCYNFGRNLQDGLSNEIDDYRKYDRQIVSLGIQLKF